MKNVLTDKLAFVGLADESIKMEVYNRLQKFVELIELYRSDVNLKCVLKTYSSDCNLSRYYSNNHQLRITRTHPKLGKESFEITISYYPPSPKKRYFRIEFTPTKARRWGTVIVSDLTRHLFQTNERYSVFNLCSITTIHLCMQNIKRDNSNYLYSPGVEISKIYRSENNYPETHEVGSNDSDLKAIKYDKNIQVVECLGGTTNYDTLTRLEFQIGRQNLNFSTVNHLDFENTVLSTIIIHERFLDDTFFDFEFRDNAFKYGINKALSELEDEYTTRKYRNKLKMDFRVYDFPYKQEQLNWGHFYKVINVFR